MTATKTLLKTLTLLTVAATMFSAVPDIAKLRHKGCYRRTPEEVVQKHAFKWEEPDIPNDKLPKAFSWANKDGINYLTSLKNQHIPTYCGACWAEAATSSLADRIAILRNNTFPEIVLSVQPLMDCDFNEDGGACYGGDSFLASKFIFENNVTDFSCSPYLALGFKSGTKCTEQSFCKTCSHDGTCTVPKGYNTYKIETYGKIDNKTNMWGMMKEIIKNGPISCSVDAIPMLDYNGTGVIMQQSPVSAQDHVVSVVGWGELDNGTKYWEVRNSWGEYWGNEGFGKVYRSLDGGAVAIQGTCDWAIPKDTWSNKTKKESVSKEQAKTPIEILYDQIFTKRKIQKNELIPEEDNHRAVQGPEEVLPESRKFKLDDGLAQIDPPPKSFTWADKDGVNYLSVVFNQHAPRYCSSSWVIAAISSLSDRINIQRENAFPRTLLSPQHILNCAAGGTCKGGSLSSVFKYGHNNYLVEYGCRIYEARDPLEGPLCSPVQICQNCNPDYSYDLKKGLGRPSKCTGVKDYPAWKVRYYGKVKGVKQIKNEILNWGPVTCGIKVTEGLRNDYKAGEIYSEQLDPQDRAPNHAVSVVGWGASEDGTEYWIVRNSWGTFWGEDGFFKLAINGGNLGLGETNCYWGIPEKLQ